MAQAATTFSTGNPYPHNADINETLSIPGASALVVIVSEETYYDYVDVITITDSNGNPVGTFFYQINERFVVESSSIDVRFTSDSYNNKQRVGDWELGIG